MSDILHLTAMPDSLSGIPPDRNRLPHAIGKEF
jgi:hypothetical protein